MNPREKRRLNYAVIQFHQIKELTISDEIIQLIDQQIGKESKASLSSNPAKGFFGHNAAVASRCLGIIDYLESVEEIKAELAKIRTEIQYQFNIQKDLLKSLLEKAEDPNDDARAQNHIEESIIGIIQSTIKNSELKYVINHHRNAIIRHLNKIVQDQTEKFGKSFKEHAENKKTIQQKIDSLSKRVNPASQSEENQTSKYVIRNGLVTCRV